MLKKINRTKETKKAIRKAARQVRRTERAARFASRAFMIAVVAFVASFMFPVTTSYGPMPAYFAFFYNFSEIPVVERLLGTETDDEISKQLVGEFATRFNKALNDLGAEATERFEGIGTETIENVKEVGAETISSIDKTAAETFEEIRNL